MQGGLIGKNVYRDRQERTRSVTEITEIRIGSKPYRVEWRPPEDTDLSGAIRYSEGRIIISPDVVEWDRRETLLHECLHGILTHAGERNHPEHVIDKLGRGLIELFRTNPDLLEVLRAPLD